MKKRNKSLLLALLLAVAVAGVAGAMMLKKAKSPNPQSHPAYSLNLHSGTSYPVAQASELMFDIRDQNNKVLKDFDTVHEKQMHLIVVRKDRTNFQHVHPEFDQSSGMFTISGYRFPADGEYRVFADFTPASAQKDAMGMKMAATPYKDVKAGTGNYPAEPPTADKLISNANGLQTELVELEHDTVNTMSPGFSTGGESSVTVSIKKDGQAFTRLENYLGALGHMVVLGPSLEFIHAHPQASPADQTGFIFFSVRFPEPGRYKLFLQTQASGQVTTTDYAITAKGESSGSPGDNTNDMEGMNHGGH